MPAFEEISQNLLIESKRANIVNCNPAIINECKKGFLYIKLSSFKDN